MLFRSATDYRVPIILKLAACRVEQDVKIAAKTGCDAIVVDGTEGSTAASPEFQLDHTGVPTLTAIPAARRALEDIGMYGKITLIASGGIRSGVDAAKALALGADCVAIGTPRSWQPAATALSRSVAWTRPRATPRLAPPRGPATTATRDAARSA